MYRIELEPGEETALRTVEELAIGIRNGVITPRARIWHNAGQQWLPIELHPHYQAALAQREDSTPPSGDSRVAPPADEPALPDPSESDSVTAQSSAMRQRLARRPIGLLVAGLVVISGAQMVVSWTAFGWLPTSVLSAATAAEPTTPAIVPQSRRPNGPAAITATPVADPPAPPTVSVSKPIPGGAVVRGPVQRATPAPSVAPAAQKEALPPAPIVVPVATDHPLADATADSARAVPPAADSSHSTSTERADTLRP